MRDQPPERRAVARAAASCGVGLVEADDARARGAATSICSSAPAEELLGELAVGAERVGVDGLGRRQVGLKSRSTSERRSRCPARPCAGWARGARARSLVARAAMWWLRSRTARRRGRALVAGPRSRDREDRVDLGEALAPRVGHQAVLELRWSRRIGSVVSREEVDDRRAAEGRTCRRSTPRRARRARGRRGQDVERRAREPWRSKPVDVDEEELLGEGEVLLEQPVAAAGCSAGTGSTSSSRPKPTGLRSPAAGARRPLPRPRAAGPRRAPGRTAARRGC